MSDEPIFNRGELGPYLIERKLGQGAMGGVYLGKHKVLEVHHAIKMIHSRLLADKTAVERFLREARNTAKMKHMNIVQVVGADLVDGVYYLAMEFVEGKTLEQMMRNPGLTVHDAVRYVHMVANALQYAHSRGIIHRDIKPQNIMVNEEDVAKLMDFGLVRDIEPAEPGTEAEQLTMAGFIMGTPQYMPVEQWNGENVDHRSDIYALGVTLYVALTGKVPFPGKSPRDIFRRVLTSEAIDVRTHNSEIDDELAAIVHKAIQPEKDDRYQSAGEFAVALESWWDQHPYQGTSLFKAPVMDETRSRAGLETSGPVSTRAVLTHHSSMNDSAPTASGGGKGPVFAIVGLAAILALVAGGWFLFGNKGGGGNTAPGNTPVVAPPVFEIEIAADEATEANPLAVSSSTFSVPGKGNATLDGKPYEFGSACELSPGMNELEVAPAAGGAGRKLFVLLDTEAPVLDLPVLGELQNNMLPTRENRYTLRGNVSDKGCGLEKLKLELSVNKDNFTLQPDKDGNFEQPFKVENSDLEITLTAEDRAGNRSEPVNFWIIPDRVTLGFTEDWEPEGLWVTTREFDVAGKLTKSRGVVLKVDGTNTPVADDGSFRATVTREPGAHEIKVEAEDWLGGRQSTSRKVFVDLEGPTLTLEAPETIRLKKLPGSVKVKIGIDDPNGATLTVNGDDVKVGDDMSVEIPLNGFGDVKVAAQVKDPAGRGDRREVTIHVLKLEYELIGKNKQGYREFNRLVDDMVMVEVPGGEFTRGDPHGDLQDADPQKIKLSAFLIAKYEVSNKQYATFLTAKKVSAADVAARGWLTKDEEGRYAGLVPDGTTWMPAPGIARLPVVNVTWRGAHAYCDWADPNSGELPTEAQWEYAARGTDGRDYPWGNANPTNALANFFPNREAIVDVQKYADGASPFGVYNLAGNVEEWCLDWYTEGSYRLPDQKGTDPAVRELPSGFDKRVVRGGSFLSPIAKTPKANIMDTDPGNLQAYARARRLPDTGAVDRGFRPAAGVPAE